MPSKFCVAPPELLISSRLSDYKHPAPTELRPRTIANHSNGTFFVTLSQFTADLACSIVLEPPSIDRSLRQTIAQYFTGARSAIAGFAASDISTTASANQHQYSFRSGAGNAARH